MELIENKNNTFPRLYRILPLCSLPLAVCYFPISQHCLPGCAQFAWLPSLWPPDSFIFLDPHVTARPSILTDIHHVPDNDPTSEGRVCVLLLLSSPSLSLCLFSLGGAATRFFYPPPTHKGLPPPPTPSSKNVHDANRPYTSGRLGIGAEKTKMVRASMVIFMKQLTADSSFMLNTGGVNMGE